MSWEKIAEVIGLWIAEGDSKTQSEITFTNSEPALISMFYGMVCELFPRYACRIRLYVYSASGEEQPFDICPPRIRLYTDTRATRPYGMVRLASTHCKEAWNEFVFTVLQHSSLHPGILRGIFAGEGSIQTNCTSKVRVLRIAQIRSQLFDDLLHSVGFDFSYYGSNRTYEISRRKQWDKANNMDLCSLHPQKEKQFHKAYSAFQQYHYSTGYLLSQIRNDLIVPHTRNFLAKKYSRSPDRIYDIFQKLKETNEITNFRVGSTNYWVLTSVNIVIISQKNNDVLQALSYTKYISSSYIATYLNKERRTIDKHLSKLARTGLVCKNKSNTWKRTLTKKQIVIR